MKKVIVYCTLIFSSVIALAILLHGLMLSNRLLDALYMEDVWIVIIILFLFLLLILSIILSLIGLYKKVKNEKE